MAFSITPNNLGLQLLANLLGNTTGLSNITTKVTGDRRGFGVFKDDPFGLQSGIVLGTGKVAELAGKNISDGGFSPGISVPLSFTPYPDLVGATGATGVYWADLSSIGFDIRSISIADSGSTTGGAPGQFSGFDLDGIKLSRTFAASAAQAASLTDLSDQFDFSPAGTSLSPGTQRPGEFQAADLFGTVNGNINNAVAKLGAFDANPSVPTGTDGLISFGDAGRIGFDLTQPILKGSGPLFLYIGEAGNNGEVAAGQISVSNRPISGLSDLSTDFGLPGDTNDTITLQIDFDVDSEARRLFFQYVFGSEEFVEFAGQFNDAFSLKLNGFNLAKLNNGSTVTINNLTPTPFDRSNPDFIYNPATTGPAANVTRLDGYTRPVLFEGDLIPNVRNSLTITIQDTRDGLFDSAVFLKAGTFGIDRPPNIDPGDDPDNPGSGTPSGTGTQDDPFNGGGGSTTTPPIGPGSGTVYFDQFGGVGRGVTPSEETIAEVDTLKFVGAGLVAQNLLLTQIGTNLQVSFEDFASPIVILRNFTLDNLDNILQPTATANLANILFDGQVSPQDSFDVLDADSQQSQIFNPNSVTFLNDLDNDVQGFDDSDDVINGQGGNDLILGLGGNDLLRGELGNDTLIGGAGTNVLTGNIGADVFGLALDGVQFVTDFTFAQDKIELADGISVTQLKIEQGTGPDSSNTWIKLASDDLLLMSLRGVTASALTTDVFLPASN